MQRGMLAAVVALVSCDSPAPAKPCTRGATLEVAVVDDGAEYTKSLYRRVGSDRKDAPTDPAAIAAGVRADIDMWKRDIPSESGLPIQAETHTDYYLRARDRATLETYLADGQPPPADRALRYETVEPHDDGGPGDMTPYVRTYLVVMPPFLDTSAVARVDGDANGSDVPLINVTLTADGKRTLTAATTAAARKRIVVMVDGEVVSAPIINEPVTAGRFSMPVSQARMNDVLAKLACVK